MSWGESGTDPQRAVVGRLAPTPSGLLHLGNVLAFAAAWLSVRSQGGELLLRVEDVDRGRARRHIEDAQKRDLEWLGLTWDRETRRQSERDYAPWVQRLGDRVYWCRCTRAMVRAAGGVYPGTCRQAGHRDDDGRGRLRFRLPDGPVTFVDRRFGPQEFDPTAQLGDPVLQRHDGFYTYPLAVVADDIDDGVTEVVRGADLLSYTAVQIRLFQAFGAQPPTWMHSPLVLGADGKKLSKSHNSVHVGELREAGATPADIWRRVLPWLGLHGEHVSEAISTFDPTAGPLGPIAMDAQRG